MKRPLCFGLGLVMAACGRSDATANSPPAPSKPAVTIPAVEDPTPPPEEEPVVVTTPSHARIAASSNHTCAIVRRKDESIDRVKCWGSNVNGELGLGDRTPRTAAKRAMGDALPFVDLPEVRSLLSIHAKTGRTCALEAGGDLWCWGEGWIDPTDDPPAPPSRVPLPGAVTAFSMSRSHACAVMTDASVRCWGTTRSGALGSPSPGAPSRTLRPVELGTSARAIDVTTGYDHTCVLLSSGRVKCFGEGMYGQLGLADTEPRGVHLEQMGDALPYVDFGDDFLATAVSASALHTCALSTNHTVTCWGNNNSGQLGRGHTQTPGRKPGQSSDAAPTPLPPTNLGARGDTTMVRAGNSGSCALIGGGIKCWGGGTGKGGNPGEMADALPFVDLGTGRTPVEVATETHSCAVVVTEAQPKAGHLLCWGPSSTGATGLDVDEWHFERDGVMGDALPFVDLGKDVYVALADNDGA